MSDSFALGIAASLAGCIRKPFFYVNFILKLAISSSVKKFFLAPLGNFFF